jgi:hypothetical protein
MRCHLIPITVLVFLYGCGDQKSSAEVAQAKEYGDWLEWHDAKRDVENKIDELTNAPGGADCPAIIDVYKKSGWPADIIDLDVGGTIVGCYGDPAVARRPLHSMDQGFDMMEKAALSTGEGRTATPQKLRLWFERGVGTAPNFVMAPIPELAECWMKVEKDSYDDKIDDPGQVTSCIALRKQLATKN